MTKLRFALATFVALFITIAIVPQATAAEENLVTSLRVISANVQGDDVADPTWDARNQTSTWGNVDVLTFQELCRSDWDRLQTWWLPGWAFTHHVVKRENACPDNGHYGAKGEAIFSRHPIVNTWYKPLTGFDSKIFTLTCAEIDVPSAMENGGKNPRVCTTHLAAGNTPAAISARQTQANEVAAIVKSWIGLGINVVLTGDFNTEPNSGPIDKFHRVAFGGSYPTAALFWEADQVINDTTFRRGGAPTFGLQKFDYIFFSYNAVGKCKMSLLPIDQGGSDHHLIRAWGNINSSC